MANSARAMQALTLSTNLSKTELPKSKTLLGGTLQEPDMFRAKALQSIKASHQSKSVTGMCSTSCTKLFACGGHAV